MENALKNEDDELLLLNYRDLSIKIQTCAVLSNRELPRDFDVEAYISKICQGWKEAEGLYCSQMSL